MNKLRLSYSLLHTWDKGDIQGAIDLYFHVDRPLTEPLKRGREVHEEIEKHIKEHGSFPKWFFEYDLDNPTPEQPVTVEYNELFDLKGVFDCLDGKTLFEFKTGNTDALAWARTWQLPIYFLIAELSEIEVDKAILIRNNGKKSEFVIVHNTKGKREMARNIIDSIAPEIYAYFEQQGLV